MLQKDIEAGTADLAQACSQSLAHGVLLALCYLTPLVPWQLAAATNDQLAHVQAFLNRLLQLLDQATELALPCLANPQDSNIGELRTCTINTTVLCWQLPQSSNRTASSGHAVNESCSPAQSLQ